MNGVGRWAGGPGGPDERRWRWWPHAGIYTHAQQIDARRGRPRHPRRHSSFLRFGPTRWRMGSGYSLSKTTQCPSSPCARSSARIRRGIPWGKEGLYAVTLGALREGSPTRSGDDLACSAATIMVAYVSTGFTTASAWVDARPRPMAEMLDAPRLRLCGNRATKIGAGRRGPPSRPGAGHDSTASVLRVGIRRKGIACLLARADRSIDPVDHASGRRPFLLDVYASPRMTTLAIAGHAVATLVDTP